MKAGPPSAQPRSTVSAMRAADAVVCLSQNQPPVIAQRLGVAPERLHTTVLGIDPDYYAVGRLERGEHVLSVGTDTGRDFPTLVEAMAGTGVETRLITTPMHVEGQVLPPEVVALGTTDNARYRRELHEAAIVDGAGKAERSCRRVGRGGEGDLVVIGAGIVHRQLDELDRFDGRQLGLGHDALGRQRHPHPVRDRGRVRDDIGGRRDRENRDAAEDRAKRGGDARGGGAAHCSGRKSGTDR